MTTNGTTDNPNSLVALGDTVAQRAGDGYLRTGVVQEIKAIPSGGTLLTLAHPENPALRWVERWDAERMTVTRGAAA